MPVKDAVYLYLRDVGAISTLSREEETQLAVRAARGNKEARKKLIKSNLRLVVAIARRYMHVGVPFLDLIEEGNIGLIRAIEKFNPKKGVRISTYASWWIKQGIIRSIASQGRTIRLPVYMMERMVALNKAKQALRHKLGRPPKMKELAKRLKMPAAKVKETEMAAQNFSSLQSAINEDGAAELMDIIEDVDSISPSRVMSAGILMQDMLDLLEILDEREQDMMTMRFGLKGDAPKTLQEIGRKYKLTRERIRQIEARAIKKMKKFLKEQKRNFHSYWPK